LNGNGRTYLAENTDHNTPFIVGVSGHRDLRPEGLPHIRGAVTDFLHQLRRHLPDTELRIMSGMAVGSDLLVAQTALDLGFAVDAVLPMSLAQYAADFDSATFASLEALLAHPRVRQVELSPPQGSSGRVAVSGPARDALYLSLSRTLSRTCNLMLALWNGKSSIRPGGTADTLLRYLGVRTDRNPHENAVVTAGAPEGQDASFRFVYWVPVARREGPRAHDLESPCFISGLGDNALQRWAAMPSQLEHQLAQLNAYNREYRQLTGSRPGEGAPDSLMRTLPSRLRIPAEARPGLEQIDTQYGKADALAIYHQKQSDRLFKFFSAMTFAMGLAYLAYEKFIEVRVLLIAYLVVLLLSVGLYHLLQGRRWFAKHLMCRALAETLRAKFYLRLAAADHLVHAEEVISLSGIDRFHGFGWIGHVLTGFEAPVRDDEADRSTADACLDSVDAAWIETQRRYFASKVTRLERSSRHTQGLKGTMFVVILLVIASMIVLGSPLQSAKLLFDISLKNVLTFIMGLMAVTLGVWELHQNKMATRELLWQYRNQLAHFSRARTQLARTSSTSRRRMILAQLGKDSLMESYLWTIHRYHREHEPPGAG
jgi:hypothetical protein